MTSVLLHRLNHILIGFTTAHTTTIKSIVHTLDVITATLSAYAPMLEGKQLKCIWNLHGKAILQACFKV